MSADSTVVTPPREFATIDGAEVLQLPAERSESGFEESEPDSTAERVYAVDALAKKLKVKLPKQRPQPVDYLKFQSWWIEKNTKRVVEVAFELATERFRITLDKEVYFLKSDMNYTHLTESNLAAVMKDTKVLECHLHEKYSDNQHALSLNLAHLQVCAYPWPKRVGRLHAPHVCLFTLRCSNPPGVRLIGTQCWDLHVGAKINLFGRPSTLMACDLKTGIWLEYHAKGLRAIKESIEEVLRKFELVQLKSSLRDTGGVNKVRADRCAHVRTC